MTVAARPQIARIEAIVAAHERPIMAYAIRRTSTLADAEDVTAETFVVAWRKVESIPDEVLPWLYAVARRVLANHRRGNGRRDRLAALLRVEDVPTPMALGEDRNGPAMTALASLVPADQELLRLVAWEELGNREIARVLGISPNAVAIRLHRARLRFGEALARAPLADDVKHMDPSRTSVEVKGTQGAGWKGAAK